MSFILLGHHFFYIKITILNMQMQQILKPKFALFDQINQHMRICIKSNSGDMAQASTGMLNTPDLNKLLVTGFL